MTEPNHDLPDETPVAESELESTGDPVIDEALERLNGLAGRPVQDHPAEFEHVHRVLRDSLSGNRAP